MAQRVALFVGGQGVEGVAQFHVGVEGVVARRGALLGVGVVDGCVEFHLFGQEFAALQVGGDGILVEVVLAALAYAFLEAAEAVGLDVACEVDAGQVGELHVELRAGSPTAVVGKLL